MWQGSSGSQTGSRSLNRCGSWPTPGRATPSSWPASPPRSGGAPKSWSNGVVELKFVDRGRLLERLLDTVDHSGEDQVDRFLQAMEGEG